MRSVSAGMRATARFCARGRAALLSGAALLALQLLPPLHTPVRAQPAYDQPARMQLIEKPDGLLEKVKSQFNDISISKKRDEVTMTFRVKDWHYTESRTNLRDAGELPLMYSRAMSVSIIYPASLERILMIGLGGGSISMYFSHHMPDIRIDAVDIDPAVIDLAQRYFGIRETGRVRYYAADGRKFIQDTKEQYDLIILDAYDGGSVPSHLMTREFYEIVKQRLKPGGAVVSNVHDGTKLYGSSLFTMGSVFGPLELFPSGRGESMVVATNGPMPDLDALKKRADELQGKFSFRYSPVFLLTQRGSLGQPKGSILTDASVPKYEPEEDFPVKKPGETNQ